MLRPEWLTLLLLFTSGAHAAVAQKTFKVSAQITAGCALGAGDGSQTTDFGTLNFGTLSSLYSNVDVASTAGAGSIIVTCTPGTVISGFFLFNRPGCLRSDSHLPCQWER